MVSELLGMVTKGRTAWNGICRAGPTVRSGADTPEPADPGTNPPRQPQAASRRG